MLFFAKTHKSTKTTNTKKKKQSSPAFQQLTKLKFSPALYFELLTQCAYLFFNERFIQTKHECALATITFYTMLCPGIWQELLMNKDSFLRLRTVLLLWLKVQPNRLTLKVLSKLGLIFSFCGCLINMDPGFYYYFFNWCILLNFVFPSKSFSPLPMHDINVCLLRHRRKSVEFKRNLQIEHLLTSNFLFRQKTLSWSKGNKLFSYFIHL